MVKLEVFITLAVIQDTQALSCEAVTSTTDVPCSVTIDRRAAGAAWPVTRGWLNRGLSAIAKMAHENRVRRAKVNNGGRQKPMPLMAMMM
jgi:hypothetical protein